MKKILILTLSLLMILTTLVPSFATDVEPDLDAKTTEVTEEKANEGDEVDKSATPDESETPQSQPQANEILKDESSNVIDVQTKEDSVSKQIKKAPFKAPTNDSRSVEGEAYAVLEDDGDFIFFRSNETYEDNSTGTFTDILGNIYTGRVFAGIEIVNESATANSRWYSYKASIKTVCVANGQSISPINCTYWFAECRNLTACDLNGLNTENTISMYRMFYRCDKLANLNISSFDTSNVANMQDMFSYCGSLTELDVSKFDTSKVTNMSEMFFACNLLTSLDVSNFDTSKVTDMNSMFSGCRNLKNLDLRNFNTSKVTNMSEMFCRCSSLKQLDVSRFDTSNTANMRSMFYECSNLKYLDTSNWSTINVKDMYEMFAECYSLTKLDVSGWNTSKVENMGRMFRNCKSLTNINVSNFNTSNVTNMAQMFYSCTTFTHIDVSKFNTSKVSDMQSMFYGCKNLASLDVSNFDTSKVTLTSSMFSECINLTNLNLSGWDTSNVTNMAQMFYNCFSLVTLDVSGFNTSKNTSMQRMFSGCSKLTNLNVSNWDTSNVTDMSNVFQRCNSLINLDISGWDTSKVTAMDSMFSGCNSLTSLDVSNLNTSKANNMNGMFSYCGSLKNLDLKNFDTSNVTNMGFMFNDCKALTNLDLSNFNTNKVTDMGSMFSNNSALKNLNISSFNTSNVTDMGGMFNKCSSLERLDLSNFDTSKTKNMQYMFYSNDTALREVILGEKFSFKGNNIAISKQACLPGEKWLRYSTEDIYLATNLRDIYDGTTMSDVYYKVADIKFNSVGGKSEIDSFESYIGNTFKDVLPKATRKGFDFLGWFTEPDSGTEIHQGDEITQTEYYAHWNPHKYTLILDPNGGFGVPIPVILDYDQDYIAGEPFTYENYAFDGWNTRKNGSGETFDKFDAISMLTEENGGVVTLYAQWTQENFTVTFDSMGGSEVPSRIVKNGKQLGKLYTPEKEGYTFTGWYTAETGGSSVSNSTCIYEDKTFYARWNRNPVVTFDANGGTVTEAERVVTYNKAIGELPVPNKENYTFDGWYTSQTGGSKISSSTSIANDKTYYAHWKIRLNFDPNGGKITQDIDDPWTDTPESYTVVALAEAEKDGYEFDDWYTEPVGGTKVDIGDNINLTVGSSVYAHWKANETVKITFDPNGGSECKPQTRYKGQEIGALPRPTKSGYVFVGWYPEPQRLFMGLFSTKKVTPGEMVTEATVVDEDVTLYAYWKQTYRLTFNGNGYNSTLSKDVIDGETLNALPGMKRAQYILEGWYPSKDGTGEKLTTDTVITDDAIYYAKWIPEMIDKTSDDLSYSYSATWSNASNDNVDNINNNLNFHSANNQRQTASLHVRFEINEAVDTVVPIGAVKITIPKSVFKGWNGQIVDTNNVSSNLPKWPNKRNGMWFSYMEEEDHYILINNTELAGGAGVDATFSYSAYPNQVPGGAIDYNGNYIDGYDYYHNTFPITFAVDSNLDGTDETNDSIDLSLEMHTRVRSSQAKSCTTVKYEWDTSWGAKPVDADDYFYIEWRIDESILSTTNQPYKWSINENTIHDGTVIIQTPKSDELGTVTSGNLSTSYKGTVVTKHPKSLLEDLDENGKVFHNEAIVTEYWKSGYNSSHLVEADTVLYGRKYPTGEFDKHFVGWPTSNVNANLRKGGQEDILDENKEVYIPYELIYDGGSNGQPVTWDDETKTYNAPERTIMMRDGVQGDLMYSSGRTQQKYVWQPITGNSPLTDSDYCIKVLNVYVDEYDVQQNNGLWTDGYLHSDKSLYQPSEVWIRLKGEEDFVKYQDLPATTTQLQLPANTVGFEVRHKTKFYSTKYRIVADTYLQPTNRVKNFIRNDVEVKGTSIIKNRAICQIWNGNDEENPFFSVTNYKTDTSSAFKDLWELDISTTNLKVSKYTSSQTSTVFDVEKGTQDTPVMIKGENYNNSNKVKKLESGIFYDLLPMGTTVDESTLFGVVNTSNRSGATSVSASTYNSKKSSAIDKNYYSVEFVDNWQGSGRTMMIINVGLPEKIKACSIEFYYMLHNTYENVVDRGTTVENDVAFANTSENKTPYNGTKSNARSIIEEDQYYESIERRYGDNVAFAQASAHYIPVDAFSWGYYKSVMTGSSYADSGSTVPNNEYTYRLTYSQSEYSKSDKIVFFDILEGGTETHPSQWYGELKNVNTLAVADMVSATNENVHCAPVVYYSTKARDSFVGTDWDVTNADTWSRTKPADNADITAVAIDCSKASDGSDFIMKGKSAMNVYITMKAPGNAENISKSTTNEGVHLARKFTGDTPEGEPTFEYADSTVTIKDTDEELHKTSDPETGTETEPASVVYGDVINYTIAYTNNDEEITYHDVVLTDTVPTGLTIEKSNISIYIADPLNAVKIGNSARVKMTKDGQKLDFTVNEVLPGETVHIIIPTTVDVREGTFINQAKKISVNGYEKIIESEKTYHKVKPANVKIVKKVLGGNTVLPGATLQLLNSSNNVVEEWVSTDQPKEFILGADTYTIHEKTPPEGYLAAKDIRFEVTRDGEVTCSVEGALDTSDGNVLSMHDKSIYVDLNVTKSVTGGFGDKNKQFNFTANLTGLKPSAVYKLKKGSDETSIVASTTGTATAEFTLADGETASVTKLPSGAKAVVTEAATGYIASYTATDGSGTIATHANETRDTALATEEITLNVDHGNCTVAYTNNYDGVTPTGVRKSNIALLSVVMVLITSLLMIRKKLVKTK